MRTTLDLPDALMREVKIRAAQRDQKLKEVVEELLRLGLGHVEAKLSSSKSVSAPSPPIHPESRARRSMTRRAPAASTDEVEPSREPVDESVIDSSFPL